jgi:hypothetical protein
MTIDEKKIAYWKWVNDMVLLNDMTNMFLPKSLKSDFQKELPNTDDVEVQYQFMLNYNANKAKQLREEMSK